MKYQLRVFGPIARFLGSRAEAELPSGATVRDLLDYVESRWSSTLPSSFWDAQNRRFRSSVSIMVRTTVLETETAGLPAGEDILIILPIAGG